MVIDQVALVTTIFIAARVYFKRATAIFGTQSCIDRAPTLNCKPSAFMTLTTVAKLGLPCSPKAL